MPDTVHEQVRAFYGTEIVSVDHKIMGLLRVLWHRGFKTSHSCQGGGHPNGLNKETYIVFDSYHDAARFQRHTMELLIRAVPDYFERCLDERDNILCCARVSLEPMDPIDVVIRGAVTFRHQYLGLITVLWEDDK